MFKKIFLIGFFLFLSNTAWTDNRYPINELACSSVDKKIVKVKTQMRIKYTETKGKSLRSSLNALRKQKSYCKRKRFSTS